MLRLKPQFGPFQLAAVLLCLALSPAGAGEPDAEDLLDGVQRWLDGTVDLQGRFEQALVSGALGAGIEESGRLYLVRPGRMRWDYLEPERKVALLEGDRTRLYLEEDQQLWEGRLEESEGLVPLLLAGERPLEDLFVASLVEGASDAKDAWVLRLVPRQGDESIEEVLITVRRGNFAIEAAEVLDGAGNRIVYRFRSLRRNRGVSLSLFHFEPPPGTEIVRP